MLPMLMRRFHEAKLAGDPTVTVWGSGRPMRELLHVDDLADGCVFLMNHYNEAQHINVGTGVDVTIKELAETVADVVYPGVELVWDSTKPDGAPRKLLDVGKIQALGWRHRIDLRDGIESTYEWYCAQDQGTLRGIHA